MNSDELINIVDSKISELQEKHNVSEAIHNDWNFEKGLMIGMESVYEFLNRNFEMTKREEPLPLNDAQIEKNKKLLDKWYGDNDK